MDGEFDDLSYRVIGAALEVHHVLGPGLLESMDHAAMKVALEHRGFSYESEIRVPVNFEGVAIGFARIDLVVDGRLIVELKAIDACMTCTSLKCEPISFAWASKSAS